MHITLRSIALSFAILVTGASATVSLSSFTPRVDNIDNTQCRAAYTTTIKGCVASDFSPPNRCSSACVQGLVDIGALIQRVCANVDVGETSIIGVFQFGIGIASLCPGVEVVTITSKSQAQTTWTATSRPATNSVPPAYSLATTFTSTTASTTSAFQVYRPRALYSSRPPLQQQPGLLHPMRNYPTRTLEVVRRLTYKPSAHLHTFKYFHRRRRRCWVQPFFSSYAHEQPQWFLFPLSLQHHDAALVRMFSQSSQTCMIPGLMSKP
jgi:hypothetical protein